jgi:hypothetical protein
MTASPISRRRSSRRTAASLAVAALVGAVLAPGLAADPATAAPACATSLAYGASASADLLRLHALDLRPLGIGVGPIAALRVASTGAGLAADAEVAAAAAARDVTAHLRGLAAVGAAELGRTAHQQAPPTSADPVTHAGRRLDLGVLSADLGTISARATWDEPMRCDTETGTSSRAAASLVDAAALPGRGGQALVALPDQLSSAAETGLVRHEGKAAAQARASASLTDLRLFAGSGTEVRVRVMSEPVLEVIATGRPDSSSVRYHAPVLEISGPGLRTQRLDSPGAHLDVALPASGTDLTALAGRLPALAGDPLGGLLTGLDPALDEISSQPATDDPPLELSGLPGLLDPPLPLLGEVLAEGDSLTGRTFSVLRLSVGALHQETAGVRVSASASSLRLQVLAWQGTGYSPPSTLDRAVAAVDLGIGLLEAAATAPAPGDGCGGCPEPGTPEAGIPESGTPESGTPEQGLPVTGEAVGSIVGAGILLALAGRFLMVVTGRRDRARHGYRVS